MIPDHLINKALDAWIGDHNCPHPDLIHVYRVLITRSLEAVAADIWDQGHQTRVQRGPDECTCNAWNEDECACGNYGTGPITTPNPYRASETA